MGLFKANFYRNFAAGFALGAALLAMEFGAIPQALAATF